MDSWHYGDNYTISIHALREEGDSNTSYQRAVEDIFLSTPSARRATHDVVFVGERNFISIHALREEGDTPAAPLCNPNAISIHALREEGDVCASEVYGSIVYFYPRPPRGGRLLTT